MTNEFAGTGNGELLKSLVSISDAINEQIFNANQTIDGSFINRQAIIADIDPIENLKLQMEEREKDEDAKDNLVSAVEKLESDREEAERKAQEERAELWANSEHTYAGQTMSAPQWLATIDWFQDEDNIAAWEAEMVKRGITPNKIRSTKNKMDQLDNFILKESRGELLTTAEKREMETLSNDKDVQTGHSVRRNLMDLDQSVTNAANVTHGTNRISQRMSALEIADSTPSNNDVNVNVETRNVTMESNVTQISTSISKSIDGVGNTSGLTASFNQNAEGVVVKANNPTPTNNNQPITKVAANFDATTGML